MLHFLNSLFTTRSNSLSSTLINLQTFIGYAATGITLVLIALIKFLLFNSVFFNIYSLLFTSSLPILILGTYMSLSDLVHGFHPLLKHLQFFPFYHLSSFENDFCTFYHTILCSSIMTCLRNSLINIFQDLMALLVDLQVVYKLAMCLLDFSFS